jgi:superfamily II DNA/RNA helicase
VLNHLAVLAAAAEGTSSKLSAVRRLLQRCSEQVLLFSEYRDVVELAARAVADVASVAILHGGLPPRERHNAVRAFSEGTARVLAATDAAGEGLNLHQRCRLVVNLELPWNPQRLEQRIGRVDRLGQTRRVHAIHLVHRDSFEARVIARLAQRSRTAQLPLTTALEQVEVPAVRERRLRTLAAFADRRHAGESFLVLRSSSLVRPGAVYAPRGHHRRRLHMLFTTVMVDRSGRQLRRHVSLIRAPMSLQTLTRRGVRSLASRADITDVLRLDITQASEATRAACAHTAAALERRCRAIDGVLAARHQQTTYQGSLFDRRAEQQARSHQDALLDLRAHIERRIADAAALRTVTAGPPRLVAAWLGE